MSENKENDNKIERDLIEEAKEVEMLNDQTLEIMNQTLASIDNKMDIENSQLQKLDELSEIKSQLNRLEDISLATTTANVTTEPGIKKENSGEMTQSATGHNQQEISELLEKIDILEKKILTIENQSNNSSERFKKIENVLERFKYLENEIQNLFKKKYNYNEKFNVNEQAMLLDSEKTTIPKDTASMIEEAENSLENTGKESSIYENYEEEPAKKSNTLGFLMKIFLLLSAVIAILFFLNEYQIIDFDLNNLIKDIFYFFNLSSETLN